VRFYRRLEFITAHEQKSRKPEKTVLTKEKENKENTLLGNLWAAVCFYLLVVLVSV